MPQETPNPVISRVLAEQNQSHPTRKHLYEEIEEEMGRTVVSFFTSFRYPVAIEDQDADVLEGILQTLDLDDGLALLISSPGGVGLTAERIINICRNYSGTGEYWAIVPSKAKSAATMICLGASKVMMGPASELGPIDPQLVATEAEMVSRLSVYNVIESYEDLFQRAVEADGNLQPYLQQLQHYDEREVSELRDQLHLSKDIAIRSLETGMMEGRDEDEIEDDIQVFLTPEKTKTHGRPIYRNQADECGLNVEARDPDDDLWEMIYELYIRTDNFVSTQASKCIESRADSFTVPPREGG